MKIRNFLNVLAILTLSSVSLTSFSAKSSSSYIDHEGYCVVNIHPSNKMKYVRQAAIKVPDINEHTLRIIEEEQNISNTKLCNGDSLVSNHYYATSDYIDHDGSRSGYNIFTTDKGYKIVVKSTGSSQMKKGSNLSKALNIGRIIGGTGDFVSAEGGLQYKGTFNWKKEIININTMILRYKIVSEESAVASGGVQIYAHRGTREYFPENTIPAYQFAMRMHANWLDGDVHLTKDGQLVIIHDDTLPTYYLKDANGQYVNTEIYVNDLTLSQLKTYYMGVPRPETLYAFLFPHQRVVGKTRIPALDEAVTSMDRYSSSPVYWQLEIKTNPTNPKLSDYRAITTKLVDFIQDRHMVDRVEVQAFDWRALRLIHQLNPKIHTAALLDHSTVSFKHQPSPIDGVWTEGMKPEKYQWDYVAMAHAIGAYCYEPFEEDLTPSMVVRAHQLGMKVVPWHWAENQGSHMDATLTNHLIDMGVDGLIVDDLPGTSTLVAQRDLQAIIK